ncbi:MAG: hypothetical protein R3B47_08190 [Bacteroidia bacterium]
MKTNTLIATREDQQTIQLVKGIYTPDEASDVLLSLLDEKINFHKVHRLKLWEGNHNYPGEVLNARIQELEQEKVTARQMVAMAKTAGKKIRISGVLEMSLEE